MSELTMILAANVMSRSQNCSVGVSLLSSPQVAAWYLYGPAYYLVVVSFNTRRASSPALQPARQLASQGQQEDQDLLQFLVASSILSTNRVPILLFYYKDGYLALLVAFKGVYLIQIHVTFRRHQSTSLVSSL